MPSPFRREQLSPAMQERYGFADRARRNRIAAPLAIVAILAVTAVAGWLAFGQRSTPIHGRMLQWQQISPATVRITYAVTKPSGTLAYCALRTQDRSRADTGFAIVPVPTASAQVQQTVDVTTLAPIAIAELLDCAPTADALPASAFPPGVAPPAPAFSEVR